MIRRTSQLSPPSEPCPRLDICTYRDKGRKCHEDRGGDCYRWVLTATGYVDEEET